MLVLTRRGASPPDPARRAHTPPSEPDHQARPRADSGAPEDSAPAFRPLPDVDPPVARRRHQAGASTDGHLTRLALHRADSPRETESRGPCPRPRDTAARV